MNDFLPMNNFTTPQMNDFTNITKYGTFYYPASKHYSHNNPAANVVCDRCKRSGLDACIGWNDQDLCLSCVNEIIKTHSPIQRDHPESLTFMQQSQFRTNMQQSQFRPTMTEMEQSQFHPLPLTRMIQSQFEPR